MVKSCGYAHGGSLLNERPYRYADRANGTGVCNDPLSMRKRLFALLRSIRDVFPLTTLGVGVLVSSGLLFAFVARPRMNFVLSTLTATLGGVVVIALLSLLVWFLHALFYAFSYWNRTRARGVRGLASLATAAVPPNVEALRAVVGIRTSTHAELPLFGWIPFVDVRGEWDAPAHVSVELERKKLTGALEMITPTRRSFTKEIVRRVHVEDAFGLARITFTTREPREVMILPQPGVVRELRALIAQIRGDGAAHPDGVPVGDRIDLRAYTPRDPARYIHWKAYARTGELLVRDMERNLQETRRLAIYFVGGPHDEASAGLAYSAVREGAFGAEWSFGADGSDQIVSDAASVERLLAQSQGETSGTGLARFLKRVERVDAPVSLVLFIPAGTGPWVAPVQAALAGRSAKARLIVGVDGIAETASWKDARTLDRNAFRTLLKSYLFRPRPPMPSATELLGLRRAFTSPRGEVAIVERRTGRILGDEHLKRRPGQDAPAQASTGASQTAGVP